LWSSGEDAKEALQRYLEEAKYPPWQTLRNSTVDGAYDDARDVRKARLTRPPGRIHRGLLYRDFCNARFFRDSLKFGVASDAEI